MSRVLVVDDEQQVRDSVTAYLSRAGLECDSLPDARSGFVPSVPEKKLRVHFSAEAQVQIDSRADGEQLKALIIGLLEIDPRPAYKSDEEGGRVYGIRLYDFDLRWRVSGDRVEVIELAAV